MNYLDRVKLEQYITELKIEEFLPNSENEKWYNQALQDTLDAIDKFGFEPDYERPKYVKQIGKISWLGEKLFRSKLLFKSRMENYRVAYEQGRFDEWIELTHKSGKYLVVEEEVNVE